ncbi:response regulator [Sinorhizobium meliloti]|uniref:PhyR-type response regulator RsiB2 n=1 Tax=Rhizobium meliloti TaxID=382 RepID=UPI000FD6F97B|nr:PhyR-type response regulator RsiB2 [Sinorhizobium meliloti]RVQ44654.1 response regulator [Sinorhizobium meliloti]
MPLSTRIAPHLPYLRRYARAVTGSQAAGDAYVAAVLEALIDDLGLFPVASNDRIGLYKLFCSLFGKLKIDRTQLASPFAWEQRAASNLSLIAPPQRQAFLLVALEGFSTGEAAEIMGLDQGAFGKLLTSASEEISRQIATDVMIIEDEPLIALDIEDTVTSLGHRVTGIARTRREALDLYHQTSPKMVLADIQLADGSSGIDAVNDILTQAAVPVIFITAFPERLLTGKKPEPAFLVTKPFNPETVKALISQALFFDEHAQAGAS